MTTRDTVQGYFDSLAQKSDWARFLDEDMVFMSLTYPVKRIMGKDAFLRATNGFYAMIAGVEVRELMTQDDRAIVLARYTLQPPGGSAFQSDVAELFTVRDGRIAQFSICFDTAPYPKPQRVPSGN